MKWNKIRAVMMIALYTLAALSSYQIWVVSSDHSLPLEQTCNFKDFRVFRSPFSLHHYTRSAEEYESLRTHPMRGEVKTYPKASLLSATRKSLQNRDEEAVCFDISGMHVFRLIEALRELTWEERAWKYHSTKHCVKEYHQGDEGCSAANLSWIGNQTRAGCKARYVESLDTAHLQNKTERAITNKDMECRRHFLTALVVVNVDMGEERYIREWIDAHTIFGFDHIFVTAMGLNASTRLRPLLKDYITWGAITYAEADCMRLFYLDFYPLLRQETFWIAILELDEFMFPPMATKKSKPFTFLQGAAYPLPAGPDNQLHKKIRNFLQRYTRKCLHLKPNPVEGMRPYRPGQWMIPFVSFGPRRYSSGTHGNFSDNTSSVVGSFFHRRALGWPRTSFLGKSIILTDALTQPADNFPHWQRTLNPGYDFLHKYDPLWIQAFEADWWISIRYLVFVIAALLLCISFTCLYVCVGRNSCNRSSVTGHLGWT